MTPKYINKWLLILTGLLFANCSVDKQYEDVKQVQNPKDNGGGYISDRDHFLSDSTVKKLNTELATLDQSGKAQVAVVLLNSIGNEVPKDFTVELFNFWKIGSKEKDNGLLILIIKDQQRVEFETGYGLEGILPDITCFHIQQEYMVPYFKSGDYNNGISQGINALMSQLNQSNTFTQNQNQEQMADTLPYEALPTDFYEVWWEDNIYTVKVNDKISFLKAWTIARNSDRLSDLPEIPDSSQFLIELTPDGYTYTMLIPSKFSFANGLQILWNSLGSLLLNTLVALLIVFVSFNRNRNEYNKSEEKLLIFSNKLYFNKWFTFLFLFNMSIVLLEVYLYFYQSVDVPVYISLGIVYLTWCLYIHLHYMIILPIKAIGISDRYLKHEALSEAHRHLKVFTFIFPLPFLGLFYLRIKTLLHKLRETPYSCECGMTMTKLNEIQDNEFISSGDIREEELKSIDYDVWVCPNCDRQRVLGYENFQSSAIRCNFCSKKTVKMEKQEVVEEATTVSSGFGYRNYLCSHCNEQTKVRFVIPKKSSSRSSSDSDSSSSGSSSSSWGGGSSGGCGAGSSW